MKKLFLAASVALVGFLLPIKAHAVQFTLPYITQQSTTITNAPLILSTATAPGAYMNCIQHLTVTSNLAGAQFGIATATVTATNTLSPNTTAYVVTLSSDVPYDTQWATSAAYCGPPNNQMTIFVTGGIYTISVEQFTSKGWMP